MRVGWIVLAAGCSFRAGLLGEAPNDGMADGPGVRDVASPDASTIGLVQAVSNRSASGTSASLQFPSSQTNGDFTVVVCSWTNGADVMDVTDDANNTYVVAGSAVQLQNGVGTVFAKLVTYEAWNIRGGKPTTVTIHYTSPASSPELRIAEFSGIETDSSPLDGWAYDGNGGASLDSGTVMTKNNHDLLIAADVVGSTCDQSDPAFTLIPKLTDVGDTVQMREVTATSSYIATAHQTSSTWWLMTLYAFRAAM